jgi:hypothetical protein
MLFLTYELLSLSGALVVIFWSLMTFSKQTNQLNNIKTLKTWWSLKAFFVIGAVIFITVTSFLLTVTGGDWLVKYFSAGQFDGTTPFGFYAAAFLSGLLIQLIADKWSASNKPVQLDLRDLATQTNTPKDELIPPKDN